jgi:hypothetical protein
LIRNWFAWLGPILLIGLIALVAFTSLISTRITVQVVNSVYFIAIALIVVGVGLIANLFSFPKNNFIAYSRIIIHLGLAIGLTGIYLNQARKQNGYLFLEASGKAKNYYLNNNLKGIDELSIALRIDSINVKHQKGFNPAPIAWLHYNNYQKVLTYNHPFYYQGIQFLLTNMVDPGFPHTYEISINNQLYNLLHNQKLRLTNGTEIWSNAFDPEAKSIGLMVMNRQEWLSIGDTLKLGSSVIVLESVDFAQHQGVILLVKDISLRFIIYLGFGLILIGLIPMLFEKKSS